MDSRFMEGPGAGWAGWWLLRARHKGGQADVRKREHNELSGWSDFISDVYPDSVSITFCLHSRPQGIRIAQKHHETFVDTNDGHQSSTSSSTPAE